MTMLRILTLMLLLGSTVWAETVRFEGQKKDFVYQARGQDIEIAGDHCDVLIEGSAGKVTVLGSHHDVVISDAAELVLEGHHLDIRVARVGALIMPGHHNDVLVTDCKPAVTDTGGHNEVVYGAGTLQPGNGQVTGVAVDTENGLELSLSGAGRNESVKAEGRHVVVEGSGNTINLLGKPASLTVNGALNKVSVDETPVIEVNGAQNEVTYKSGRPRIENVGVDNKILGP